MSSINRSGGTTNHLEESGLSADIPSTSTVTSKYWSDELIAGYGKKEKVSVDEYVPTVPVSAKFPMKKEFGYSAPDIRSVNRGILAIPIEVVTPNDDSATFM
jgi:hypothetical protein